MSRLYKAGDGYVKSFTVGATNADSTPTASLIRNGAADGAVTVTITNPAAGQYKAACTIPGGYAAGDVVELLIAATIDGEADKAVVDALRLVGADFTATNLPASVAAYAAGQDPATLLDTRLDSIDASIAGISGGGGGSGIELPTGTANAGGSTISFTATGAGLNATTGAYVGQRVLFTSGPLDGESRPIEGHTVASSTHTFTFATGRAFTGAPAAGNTFVIL